LISGRSSVMAKCKFKKVKGLWKSECSMSISFSEDMLKTFANGTALVNQIDTLVENLRSDILEDISFLYDSEIIEEE